MSRRLCTLLRLSTRFVCAQVFRNNRYKYINTIDRIVTFSVSSCGHQLFFCHALGNSRHIHSELPPVLQLTHSSCFRARNKTPVSDWRFAYEICFILIKTYNSIRYVRTIFPSITRLCGTAYGTCYYQMLRANNT